VLWQSGIMQTPNTNTGAFLTTSFSTGAIPLSPGQPYVFYLTTDGVPAPTDGNTTWGYLYADAYAGGGFVFLNDPNFADLGNVAWENSNSFGYDPGSDLAFTATFAVPEPSSMLLLGAALPVFLLRRRSRGQLHTVRRAGVETAAC